MKKRVIGYIFCNRSFTKEEKIFLKLSKKYNSEIVFFNLIEKINEDELEEKIKKCDIIFNNSAEDFALELVKTIESFGKKVIDSSKTFYNIEDKWIFYITCKKNKIPVPETILLSENINLAKSELEDFNIWPVVLKRISGTCGDFVEKANDLKDVHKIITKFWKKGNARLPIIAQEEIISPCYRVTVIDGKILQTAVKNSNGWKKTGVFLKDTNVEKFKVDKNLKEIIKKVVKISQIKICGIDLLKKDKQWLVLEVNSDPGFDFFPKEEEKLLESVFRLLLKELKN